MKRGFLNNSKAKARPLGPPIVSASKGLTPAAIDKLDLSQWKTTSFDVSEDGKVVQQRNPRSKITPDSMIYTTLPIDPATDEAVSECFLLPGSKELVMKTPGFPQPLIHPAAPAFRLGAVPGKGMGLFSTRALKMGDLILCERPLLVTARGVHTPSVIPNFTGEMVAQHNLDEYEKYCAIAVDRLRPDNKAAFMALANSHKEDGSGPVVGIVRTNGIAMNLDPEETSGSEICSAICKDISPNTSTHFDKASFSYRLYAVRDIAADEELTFTYVDSEPPAAERNKELKPYGFVCTCPACTDAPASDARRATIKETAPNVLLWATVDRRLPDDWIIKKSLEHLALLTTEAMQHHPRYTDATRAIMEAYICLGDAPNASKWAAKVHKQAWAGTDTKVDVGTLLDPANTAAYEAHFMWRMRVDPDGNAVAKMFHAFAALAGPDNVKTLSGGYSMMTF
ncbi:hypothetical protein DFH08DRAFT_1071955 [Mycena albidolilacea]|uniref:SET domain-containing protein n=1 Tax=Mycena albidolilacea TaxID=1033008 RepID=A0AAD7AR66_9AGAR|nr:hypothetical protein DFH08DRAFT_1071955 [Mycena albidolilacea]